MIKTGHELSDSEITARYEKLGGEFSMRPYFYAAVAEFAGEVDASGRPAAGEPLRAATNVARSPHANHGAATVLDAGCGAGELLAAVQRRNPEAKLLGLELASSRVAAAQRRLGSQAEVRVGSLTAPLPFPPQCADMILVTEVLEHLKDPAQVLRHLSQWLRPGGVFILSVPNGSAWLPFSPLAEHVAPHFKPARGFLPHEHPLRTEQPIDTVFSFSDIYAILRAGGLRVTATACTEVLPYLAEFAYKFVPGWDIAPLRRPFDQLATRLGWTALGYRLMLRCVSGA
ncbi:MAG: class I SAM-dependent methyltransferase [Anaerolineales bacterium]